MHITVRKKWIDSLRGIPIILVLYGHLVPAFNSYFVFTSPIKIPLFFVITGYVFNHERKDIKSFIINIFKKLIIPWLLLSLSPELLLIPLKGIPAFIRYAGDVLIGKQVWYMPCCIIAEIIHFLVLKLDKKAAIIFGSVILSVIGLITKNYPIFEIFMFNRALFVQCYILIGFLLRDFKTRDGLGIRFAILLSVLLYIAMGVLTKHYYPGKSLDVHMFSYYDIKICLLMIAIGCCTLMVSFSTWNINNKVLSFIGENTLIFYIWGGYVEGIIVKLFSVMFDEITKSIAVLVLFASCICLSFISLFIRRFAPFMIGKKAN